jgi:hypothetical protein
MTDPILEIRRLLGRPLLWAKSRSLAAFRRRIAASRDDASRQEQRQLEQVLSMLAGSAFAKDHGLASVRTLAELRRALPVAPYERMAPYVERVVAGEHGALFCKGDPRTELVMFAMTSGTTAVAKAIPITKRSLAEYRRSWTIWGCAVAEAHPGVPFAGVLNLASGWRAGTTPAGVPCGSISGLLFAMMHKTLGPTHVVPPDVTQVDDPELRQYLALRLALERDDTMLVTTANPSTLLSYARRLQASADDLLRDVRDGTLAHRDAYPRDVLARLERALRRPRARRARELAAAASAAGALTPRVAWPGST